MTDEQLKSVLGRIDISEENADVSGNLAVIEKEVHK